MTNGKPDNGKGGCYGCWVGGCLGSVVTLLLFMSLMVLFRGKPPFNEIDLVFYLFIGAVIGAVLGAIIYAFKNQRSKHL
jgi:ABC-type Fe3+-siderophore transport system permease subunit